MYGPEDGATEEEENEKAKRGEGKGGKRVEIGAAITDGCKAIHGKLSNEFIALIGRQPPVVEQKRVRVKTAGVDVIRWLTLNSEPPASEPRATNMEPPTIPRFASDSSAVEPRLWIHFSVMNKMTTLFRTIDSDIVLQRGILGKNGRKSRVCMCRMSQERTATTPKCSPV